MHLEHQEFKKEASNPFCVKLYSENQLDVLRAQSSRSSLELIHFDATSGIIKNLINKRNFYNAVIVTDLCHRIFSIFSIILAIHDANSIFKLFNYFRYFGEEQNYWPAFTGVVSDFLHIHIHKLFI